LPRRINVLRRDRRRYLSLCVHVSRQGEVNLEEVWRKVKEGVRKLFGKQGLSLVNVSLVEARSQEGRLILRCSHRYITLTRAAVASLHRLGEEPCMIHVELVSGTLKKLRKALKARSRGSLGG